MAFVIGYVGTAFHGLQFNSNVGGRTVRAGSESARLFDKRLDRLGRNGATGTKKLGRLSPRRIVIHFVCGRAGLLQPASLITALSPPFPSWRTTPKGRGRL